MDREDAARVLLRAFAATGDVPRDLLDLLAVGLASVAAPPPPARRPRLMTRRN